MQWRIHIVHAYEIKVIKNVDANNLHLESRNVYIC